MNRDRKILNDGCRFRNFQQHIHSFELLLHPKRLFQIQMSPINLHFWRERKRFSTWISSFFPFRKVFGRFYHFRVVATKRYVSTAAPADTKGKGEQPRGDTGTRRRGHTYLRSVAIDILLIYTFQILLGNVERWTLNEEQFVVLLVKKEKNKSAPCLLRSTQRLVIWNVKFFVIHVPVRHLTF